MKECPEIFCPKFIPPKVLAFNVLFAREWSLSICYMGVDDFPKF